MKLSIKYIAFTLSCFFVLNGCAVLKSDVTESQPLAVTQTDTDQDSQYHGLQTRLNERVAKYRDRIACFEMNYRRRVPAPNKPSPYSNDAAILREYQSYIMQLLDYIDEGRRVCSVEVKNQ